MMTTKSTEAPTTSYARRADAHRDLRNARTAAEHADAMRRLGVTIWKK